MNGGSPVIDFTLLWDRAKGVYELLDTNILENHYLVNGLKAGLIYSFKVSARNIYGDSIFTNPL